MCWIWPSQISRGWRLPSSAQGTQGYFLQYSVGRAWAKRWDGDHKGQPNCALGPPGSPCGCSKDSPRLGFVVFGGLCTCQESSPPPWSPAQALLLGFSSCHMVIRIHSLNNQFLISLSPTQIFMWTVHKSHPVHPESMDKKYTLCTQYPKLAPDILKSHSSFQSI